MAGSLTQLGLTRCVGGMGPAIVGSGLKDQYAEACQNCSWSQTRETLSVVIYTLLKNRFGLWWDEMYFLHAKTKTDNLFLKAKFSEGFIHTTTTSLGILWSKNPCMPKVHYSCTFSSRNWEKGGQSSQQETQIHQPWFPTTCKKYTRDGIRRRNLQSYIFVKGHKFGMVAACTRVKQNLIDLHQ